MIKKYLKHFFYFYDVLGYRIFVSLLLSFTIGALDGLGLTMFIPLLESSFSDASIDNEQLGKLSFIVDFLEWLGLDLTMNVVLLTMGAFFILKGVFRYIKAYYSIIVRLYYNRYLKLRLINGLSNYSYSEFVKSDVGRIQNTLSGETFRVNAAFNIYFQCINAASMLTVYGVMAFLSNPQFALFISIGAVISNFFFRVLYKKTVELSRAITTDRHQFEGLMIQIINNFKYLKATSRIGVFRDKLISNVLSMESISKKSGLLKTIVIAVREPTIIIIVIFVIYLQVNIFDQPFTTIILSLLFFYRSLNFVANLQTNWNAFLSSAGSLENMTEFENMLFSGKDKEHGDQSFSFKKSIEFKNVDFSYESGKNVLDKIQLTIEKGESIAFVGESGSGKTTLVNLLVSLLKPSNGEILIDGTNIDKFKKEEYQSKIGYITQEAVIFNDSIENNITFWKNENESLVNEIDEAMQKASINDFVQSLEEKGNTLLGNNGINLSGGQKQRISIARELFREIEILILDEATSALDSETELQIKNSIDSLKGLYTIFIVAHRLSTIKNVDKVVLMSKGKILAFGSYDELYNSSLEFKKMVDLQELIPN